MELGRGIAESLKNKCILITGSTGFLAKIFVEKVLRVQPEVKKLYLLIRAPDAKSAAQRLHVEVMGKELFRVLKEKHGEVFHDFISDKVSPVAGDITEANLGIQEHSLAETMKAEIDVVVNVAATTNFNERYDLAMGINVLGAKHVLEFAKKCSKIELFLHVSTAYVSVSREGLVLEKKFHMGETLNGCSMLDIDAEQRLVEDTARELGADKSISESDIKRAMRDLGMKRAGLFGWPNTYVFTKAMGEMLLGHMRGNLPLVIIRPTIITSIFKDPLPGWMEGVRTIDSLIINYSMGNLNCFLGDLHLTMDVIPGDMVVNAMIVAMVAHSNQPCEYIYHVSSSVRNPVKYAALLDSCHYYFKVNPRCAKDGSIIRARRIAVFNNMTNFRGYMTLRYKLPLEGLRLVNAAFCQLLSQTYNELNRKYKYVMQLAELYEPFAFFQGSFDDLNLERLRMVLAGDSSTEAKMFSCDPKSIDWNQYLTEVHIPGLLKFVCK